MAGYWYHLKRYFDISRKEWLAIATTAAVMGFALSYNNWGDETFDLAIGLRNLIGALVGAFLMLALHVAANKAVAVFYGVRATYEKYSLGLVIGIFVTFLTFGLWPLWVNGFSRYLAIPNLRIGKFRATIAKDWELGLAAAGAVLASLLICIPLEVLFQVTGLEYFHSLVKISILIAVYGMIPLPLIQTSNPYQLYMSRAEMLEGNLNGYDIIWGSRAYYFLLLGVTIGFAIFLLLIGPSWLMIFLTLVLGVIGMWFWTIVRDIEHI